MFVAWVLSPFVGLIVATMVSKNWQAGRCRALCIMSLATAVLSVVVYSGLVLPTMAKPAFVFLAVPAATWAAFVVLLAVGRK
jgi:hypothetical protein